MIHDVLKSLFMIWLLFIFNQYTLTN